MVGFIIFFVGLVVGSFLNVLIYRLPQKLSLFGRSFCPTCRKEISWQDNVPLVSFILLRGRCRNCHSPISWQYPAVEAITGVLFVLAVLFLPTNNLLSIIYYLLMISTLIAVFFTDLKYGIIPDKIIYLGIIVSIVFLISQYPNILMSNLLSGVGASMFLSLLYLVTRGRGMGLGDVKLAFLMGLILGLPMIIVALYLAFLTGAAFSLILILVGKKRFGQTIPFGPLLVLGTVITLFFYEKILAIFPWVYPY